MDFLDIKSLQPRPRTELSRWSRSVNQCLSTCETHPLPARVCNAYWNGAVTASADLEHCFAIVGATNRRKTSLTTMPRTPPSGFCNAVTRPMRRIRRALGTTLPLARSVATWHRETMSLSDSSNGWRCPQLIPEGPGAAPSNGLRGIVVINSGGKNFRSATGRRSGFLNEFSVVLSPGQLCGFQCLACCRQLAHHGQPLHPGTFVVCNAPSSFAVARRRGCI